LVLMVRLGQGRIGYSENLTDFDLLNTMVMCLEKINFLSMWTPRYFIE